jgi:V/A-type H+-transporting ATPase subunit C
MGYSFINARIRGRKAKLLTAADYETLLGTEDLDEMTRRLAETDYQPLFQEFASQLDTLDNKLNQTFFHEIQALSIYLPRSSAELIRLYLQKYFFDGLKTIIRAFETETPEEEIQRLLIGTEEDIKKFQELLKADSLSLMIEQLSDSNIQEVLRENLELTESFKSTVPLELTIDRWFYPTLWKESHRILKNTDLDRAQQFIGSLIDLMNIQALLRIKRQFPALDEGAIRNLLVPINFRLHDILERSITAASPVEIFNYLLETPYRDFARLARESFEETGSLSELEMRVNGHLHYLAYKMLLGQPFNVGTFLAYLLLKNTEIQNLRAIAVGIAAGLGRDRIRRHVLIP